MYFWRIEKLKSELAAHPMSDRDVLPYVVVDAVLKSTLTSITMAFPISSYNIWNLLGTGWSIALAVLGTIYIFRQNGGVRGQQFLPRYFALGWVVGWRWFALYVSLIWLLMFVGIIEDETNACEFLVVVIAELLLFAWIGKHVRDVALATADSEVHAQSA